MGRFLGRLQQAFDLNYLEEWIANLLPHLIIAILILGVYYFLYRIINASISHLARRIGVQRSATGFLLIAVKYLLLIFGTVTALNQVGINVSSLIAGLGIAGLSLGLAAKDVLANIIAGIFIFWDRPFVIGDLIEASDVYGEVSEITLRTTRIITVDGKMVSIPNSLLANNKIASFTLHPHLRLDIDVSIGVNEDIGKAREVILGLLPADGRLLSEPAPVVLVNKVGDYYVGLQLRVWLDDARQHIAMKAELRERVKTGLDRASIAMPFETFEVIRREKAASTSL